MGVRMATETVYPNGSTAETTTFSYDYDGRLDRRDGWALAYTTSVTPMTPWAI